jgi:outer membrane usher protein
MLPYNQRGFAPIIRGIASSNAEITVRQNGYIIYQANVAPGAFEITDLYSTTNSADLDITIKEADGSERKFTQPYSSVAVMQRPGNIRYEMTLARDRSNDNHAANEPIFGQGSAIYGLNNYLTLFGGVTTAPDYQAFNSGTGLMLGDFGAISTDITWARARLDNDEQHGGLSWRLMYSKRVEATDTNFTLASYRYSTSGYYTFADANEKYDVGDSDWSSRYNKRSRLQLNLNQTILGSNLYLSGYQQDYWQTDRIERSITTGFNRVIGDVSVNLSYTYSKTDDEQSDQMVSLSFSIPLSRWLPKSWASYNVGTSKHGYTNHNVGLNGTLLDDDRLSYSLQQNRTNHDGQDNSSVFGSYRSQYANLNAGYYYSSDNSRQLTYGMSGAVVAHPAGVTLSQPLGDQFAIVSAKGASGVRFVNRRGIQTDIFGNAIIPSLSPYQENVIRIDTSSLPNDVDTDDTSMTVVPSRSAAVTTQFTAHVGYRTLITLTRPGGRIIPFGAVASVDGASLSGIVDDFGVLYLAGVNENIPLTVRWGKSAEQRCHADIVLSPSSDTLPAGIRQVNALCKPEANHAE